MLADTGSHPREGRALTGLGTTSFGNHVPMVSGAIPPLADNMVYADGRYYISYPHENLIRVYRFPDEHGFISFEGAILPPPDMMDLDKFGEELDTDGQTLAIGVPSGFGRLPSGELSDGYVFLVDLGDDTAPCADTDGDGSVTTADLLTLLAFFGQATAEGPSAGDLDGSGDINTADLLALLGGFGSDCE